MTEKRFKEIISTQKVIDTLTGKEYDCLMDTELLNILNESSYDNEKHKRMLNTLMCRHALLHEEYVTLEDENKELKKQNQEIFEKYFKLIDEIVREK